MPHRPCCSRKAFRDQSTKAFNRCSRHWVKTGVISKEMGRFYQYLFERRQIGDYRDMVTFSHEEVEKWLGEAEAFVARVNEETRKELDKEQ
jgi:uncharacterized protein (UPF0332 family)